MCAPSPALTAQSRECVRLAAFGQVPRAACPGHHPPALCLRECVGPSAPTDTRGPAVRVRSVGVHRHAGSRSAWVFCLASEHSGIVMLPVAARAPGCLRWSPLCSALWPHILHITGVTSLFYRVCKAHVCQHPAAVQFTLQGGRGTRARGPRLRLRGLPQGAQCVRSPSRMTAARVLQAACGDHRGSSPQQSSLGKRTFPSCNEFVAIPLLS